MTKFYRIDYKGTPRYAVEHDGRWRLLDGDLFDRHQPGEEISPDGHRVLSPVMPSMMPRGTSDSMSLKLPESMKIFMPVPLALQCVAQRNW